MIGGELKKELPPIAENGHVLFVGTTFSGNAGGSSVVMGALTRQFKPESFSIITIKTTKEFRNSSEVEARTLRIGVPPFIRKMRIGRYISLLTYPYLLWRSVKHAKRVGAKIVVVSFPSLNYVALGMAVAERLDIPLVAYLHDTLVESLQNSSLSRAAKRIQNRLFKIAKKIFVMSDGMVDMYRRKYNLETIPLRHIYLGPRPNEFAPCPVDAKTAFWSGQIYSINAPGLRRISRVIGAMGWRLFFSGLKSKARLEAVGLHGDWLDGKYFSNREEYYQKMRSSGVLLLTLVGHDETAVGYEEISTVFPTKTPEYLASGRPILVHCPDDYFLAKFFKKYGCGLVVSDYSERAIRDGLRFLSDEENAAAMRGNAFKAVEQFFPEAVASVFSSTVRSLI